MFARSLRNYGRIIFRRFQHSSHVPASESVPFSNKFGFDLSPPPIHEYWNIHNSTILFAFVPVFLGIAYFAKYVGKTVDANAAYLGYADSNHHQSAKSHLGNLKQHLPKKSKL